MLEHYNYHKSLFGLFNMITVLQWSAMSMHYADRRKNSDFYLREGSNMNKPPGLHLKLSSEVISDCR